MKGIVDDFGRAIIEVILRASPTAEPKLLQTWIDTGMTGELVIPENQILDLNLARTGTAVAHLADGSEVLLNTYSCSLNWNGRERQVEVIANTGQFPLLGVGLLCDHRLSIDYPARQVEIV